MELILFICFNFFSALYVVKSVLNIVHFIFPGTILLVKAIRGNLYAFKSQSHFYFSRRRFPCLSYPSSFLFTV